ncbi:diversity-generating retroelement protein Avd [Candidatus Fermentibacteria bacterium]|nr:diversity-generating retroelement protein Avd [Candidatus Fermentibacteria bacterium]
MRDDYPLFVHWYKQLDWILDTVERFPRSSRFTLGSRVADLALGVLECIVEAIYTKDRAAILRRINLDLEKLRILFRIAADRKYISLRQLEFISQGLDEAGRMTGGWSKHEAMQRAVRESH